MNINFRDKKTIGLMVAAGILILLTIAIVAIFFLFPTKKIEIPDFTNKTKIDVDAWVVENDLTTDQVLFNYEFNESIIKDQVTSQSIVGGETLKKDDVLTITLSNGPDPDLIVTLPDFKDMTHDQIEAWFLENKFTDVTYEYIPDPKIKKDYFIKSNITEKEVRRSTPVLISISVGTESVGIEVTMPDFKDYTKANIQAWGKTNNITVTFKEEASETIASGKVISQDPKAGATTKTGGKITVTMSTGKGTAAVKFDGKTKKDVDAWAKTNNIKISYEETYDNKIANGTVISNTPNSGNMKSGATMTVKLSIGKPIIENYTNKSKDSFNAHIDSLNKKSANLKVTVTEVDSDKTPGTIIEQIINSKTVSSATTVDTGTTITIKVARLKSVNVESKAGASYDDFKKYVEGLGMKVGSKGTDRYSDYTSGYIVSNDTGSKTVGTSINYVLSRGKYDPDVSTFDGKSTADAKAIIDTANGIGAGWSITFSAPEQNTSVKSGLTFGCTKGSKTVTCKVSKGSPITVELKENMSETDFINYIKGLGLTASKVGSEYSETVGNGNIIRNQTGSNFWPGQTIEYVTSKGNDPANAKATFPNYSLSTLNGSTLDETKSKVKTALSPFANISFVTESTTTEDPRPNFMVLEISIAANTPDVLISTQVTVKILVKE
ncbi:PASTA domain-containing protein [Anaerorhabdus furcosa]|uniref:PASTA domain, binds beta-lactams n=1 Tax=Anaerorhabdus furcosa TaxID=118967 RepID=A0A1T4P247_9FIRM|nr:PASTA domain-containing protein [Anaerorhabdus furcosa]SJZ85595.1 PASTA domain, binds beta-lactams [Anaerorhabdus furcosa]